jgi:RNA polymerase sigma-70 factor (ECF subfamily)
VKKSANERFFKKLFIEMRSDLIHFAEANIHGKADKAYIDSVEDIVEETFKTAWQKIDELVASKNPNGWLINALKLHILKHYEKRNKEHLEKRELYENEIEIPTETIFDNEISFSGRLSDDEMQIIKLKSAGYNHIEISDILGVPVGTIHSKVSRIKDKLRKILEGEEN